MRAANVAVRLLLAWFVPDTIRRISQCNEHMRDFEHISKLRSDVQGSAHKTEQQSRRLLPESLNLAVEVNRELARSSQTMISARPMRISKHILESHRDISI